MSGTVIETRKLRKVYRSGKGEQVAVDDLDLVVRAGGVHGFLGPNGSGKTTTIRMLLGLANPTAGEMEIMGQAVPHHLPDVIGRVGAVVEQPKFFPGFSARKNLGLLALAGNVPRERVDAVLEQVELTDRAGDRFGAYSLGMKQRLAIAATLLKDPALLILDEPTNGLDPQGIRGIRDMIRGLGASGVTVLLSSHILVEVEQVCDSVTILNRGSLVTTGRVADVIGERTQHAYRLRIADPIRAGEVLRQEGIAYHHDDDYLVLEDARDPAAITKLLAHEELYVGELTPVRADLESAFLDLTEGGER